MKCPNCNNYMKFNLAYNCGTPTVFYTCNCGYDTRNMKSHVETNVTNNFSLLNDNLSSVTTNSTNDFALLR